MILHTFFFCSLILRLHGESIGVFDDNVLFDISWPGLLPKNDALQIDSKVEVLTNISELCGKSFLMGFITGEG